MSMEVVMTLWLCLLYVEVASRRAVYRLFLKYEWTHAVWFLVACICAIVYLIYRGMKEEIEDLEVNLPYLKVVAR